MSVNRWRLRLFFDITPCSLGSGWHLLHRHFVTYRVLRSLRKSCVSRNFGTMRTTREALVQWRRRGSLGDRSPSTASRVSDHNRTCASSRQHSDAVLSELGMCKLLKMCNMAPDVRLANKSGICPRHWSNTHTPYILRTYSVHTPNRLRTHFLVKVYISMRCG